MISTEIINFINQTEDIFLYTNVDNLQTIYHYSVPNVKLFYPEPFIASASFMHSDLWFIHILIYQYWLWFAFIFIIVFFFVTFICTIRWCNMRVKPRRETRGVSRSKCGDLITATVPVTWATSIIVNESTDAIDYFDGFGTTELVVGIRAYQWGWEYYYPKDIDLNYNIKKNYSVFMGNSLKYNRSSDININSNNLWKFYQNKNFDQIITPAHLLVLPIDNSKILNFLNFNDVGSNTLYEINAFKKIKMFSKTYTSDLNFSLNTFSAKYKKFSNLYINDNFFLDSYLYGLKRQQNFLPSSSILNSNMTFMNLESINKLIKFNLKSNINFSTKIFDFKEKINNFQNKNINTFDINLIKNISIIDKNNKTKNKEIFNNFLTYTSYLNKINDDSDKKKIFYPIYKQFNLIFKKNKFSNAHNIGKLNNFNDLNSLSFFNETNLNFNNKNINFKHHTLFSPNQSVSLTNKNIKHFIDVKSNISHLNYSLNLNSLNDYLETLNTKIFTNNLFFYNLNNLNWMNTNTSGRLFNNRISFDYPYSPILSNNLSVNPLNYDSHENTFIEDTPSILQGKEELMPNFLTNIYWNFYWSNTNIENRIFNNKIYYNLTKNFYLPIFNFYYDYDFRNWQSLELLEDTYWESIYPIYTFDEYLTLVKEFYTPEYVDKTFRLFLKYNRINKVKNDVVNKSFFKDQSSTGEYYSNLLYLDDNISPSNLLKTKDFYIFPSIFSFINSEDSYESFKYLTYIFNDTNNSVNFFFNNFFNPTNYSTVLDTFRSDFDEFSWFFEENNFYLNNQDFFKKILNQNIQQINELFTLNPLDFNFASFNSLNKSPRFSNSINLRNTAKNSIVTYNAIQKVFKTRFDENRSHTKLIDFSNFYINQPFISTPRTPYEKLLGKNKENFYNTLVYKNNFKLFFNNFYSSTNSLNYYFFDFPFLIALKSDSSRYLWFDWFAKWGFYEVQPSSSSRYAIFGMPYISKNFEFNTINNENLTETETYLTRISRARKNYLTNWTYAPYFYAKNNYWYKNHIIFDILNKNLNSLTITKYLLNSMKWYWLDIDFLNLNIKQFFPSNSNINTHARANWKPQNSIQGYYYNVSHLIDILTKREFLYRELFVKNNKIVNLPLNLTAAPANNLISEIKANFLLSDLIVDTNEYSRNVFYNSLNYFYFISIKPLINETFETLNLKILSDFFFYFFNSTSSTNPHQTELYKNQFRPMRKGISNMIRLHATGAMALPIEIRLQILASSKDVIHSWAIPSAGIKIDCVPGYSSHKVMIFLVSGIFWGQCMEICGRYHHWMPIIVYFMKRDLFFLWCTHFIFLSGSNNLWNINDRQYSDYIRLASFDKNSWLTELKL